MALRVRVIKAGVFLVYPLGRDRGFRALEFRRRRWITDIRAIIRVARFQWTLRSVHVRNL
jgi:hypothetical protein